MQTTHTPTINFLTPGATPPNANRAGNGAAPEVAFNSVLSREIERPKERSPERTPERSPSRAPERSAAGPVPPTTAAQNSQRASENKSAEKSAANAANEANSGPAPASTPGAAKADGKDGQAASADAGNGTASAPTDSTTEAQSALEQASDPTAALLALVASFNQAPQAVAAQTVAQTETSRASVAAASTDPTQVALAVATGKGQQPEAVVAERGFEQVLASETEGETTELSTTLPQTKALGTKPEAAQLLAEPKAVQNAPQQASAAQANLAANPEALRAAAPQAAKAGSAGEAHTDFGPLAATSATSAATEPAALAKLQTTIAPRVASPLWDQALGQHVVYMASNGQQSATLILNPAELGPVQVTLQINNDQASASFTALQPETRQALEAAMPKLREMMSEAGISLGSATVGTSLPNNQQPGQQSDLSRGHGNGNGHGTGRFGEEADAAPQIVATRPIQERLGLVDTFV